MLENVHMNFTLRTVTTAGKATHKGSRAGRKRPRSIAEELNGDEKNDLSCQLDTINRFLTDLCTHLPIQMFNTGQIGTLQSEKGVKTHRITHLQQK